MKKIEWTDALSVGIAPIDEQHRHWIERLNKVCEAVEAHHGPEQVAQTLDFLVDYTRRHFGAEKQYMTDSEYPELDSHLVEHQKLTTTLNNLVDDFREEGPTHELAEAIDTFLGNWLVKHIKEVDCRFGEFVAEKGLTVS